MDRRSQRGVWVWGMVIAALVCGAGALVADLKADNRALQRELAAARDLADMKDQVISGLASSLSIINKHHRSQMQAMHSHLGSVHQPPHVKAWTFDGARF